MATISASNFNAPTPSKWVKTGTALTACGTAIAGYSYTQGNLVLVYSGIGLIVLGIFITNFFS